MNNPFVLFVDGIDGSGKSTLIQKLETRIMTVESNLEGDSRGCRVYDFPTEMPGREDKTDHLTRTLFYINDFHNTLKKERFKDHHRIYDRSFVSTLAYQGFDNLSHGGPLYENIKDWGFRTMIPPININKSEVMPKRNVVFLNVTCSPSTASRRVSSRVTKRNGDVEEMNENDRSKRLEDLQEKYDLIYNDLRKEFKTGDFDHDYYVEKISSDSKDPDQLADNVMSLLHDIVWPPQQELLTSE